MSRARKSVLTPLTAFALLAFYGCSEAPPAPQAAAEVSTGTSTGLPEGSSSSSFGEGEGVSLAQW